MCDVVSCRVPAPKHVLLNPASTLKLDLVHYSFLHAGFVAGQETRWDLVAQAARTGLSLVSQVTLSYHEPLRYHEPLSYGAHVQASASRYTP